MIITSENYFSREAMEAYLSVSQFKNFAGTPIEPWLGCPARAMAELRGEWKEEMSTALLVGSYVDAHFEGTLGVFKAQHPEILKKNGELLATFEKANEIIARIERDPFMVETLSGKKQVIMTAELFGVPWKIMIDSFFPGEAIVDLKIMASITDDFYVRDKESPSGGGFRVDFIDKWGYSIQAAVYQKVVEINTGKQLPFFIAAASKEKEPDIEVIAFRQLELDCTIDFVQTNIDRVMDIKKGIIQPEICGYCDYCKNTKKLSVPIYREHIKK